MSASRAPPILMRSATSWRVESPIVLTMRALSPRSWAVFMAASTIAWAGARRGSALLGSVPAEGEMTP